MNALAHYESSELPGVLALAETEEMFNGRRVRVPPVIAQGTGDSPVTVWPKRRYVRRNGLGLWYGSVDCSNLWFQECYIYLQQLQQAVQETLELMEIPMEGDEDYDRACAVATGWCGKGRPPKMNAKTRAERVLSGDKIKQPPVSESIKAVAAQAVSEYTCKYDCCSKKFLSVMPRDYCSGECKLKHGFWKEVQMRTDKMCVEELQEA